MSTDPPARHRELGTLFRFALEYTHDGCALLVIPSTEACTVLKKITNHESYFSDHPKVYQKGKPIKSE
jgi:hypothetical protein